MKKTNGLLLSFLFIVSGVALGIVVYGFFFKPEESGSPVAASYLQQKELDIVFGNDSALLTVVLYGNYSCPHCRRFFLEEIPLLKKEFFAKGTVKLLFRPILPSSSPDVLQAYKTAVCINKYGRFDYLHQLLTNQPNVVLTPEFQEMVNEFMEKDTFVAECIQTTATEEYLAQNLLDLQNLTIKGTPAFIINGKIYLGFKNHKHFSQILTMALHSKK